MHGQNPCSDIKAFCVASGKFTNAQCQKVYLDCPNSYNMDKGICGKPMQKLADSGVSDEELALVFVDCLVKKGWGLFGGSFAQFFKRAAQ